MQKQAIRSELKSEKPIFDITGNKWDSKIIERICGPTFVPIKSDLGERPT